MKTLTHFLAMSIAAAAFAAPPEPKFRAEEIDRIAIGYGLAIADVDGDKRDDVLLADKSQIVWYRNPGKAGAKWAKSVIAENLTKNDNVCIAAADTDGDGKCEVAVGAEWNPGDTVNSGAVFYLIAPADRTQKWEAVKFPAVEPTTHRMAWVPLPEKKWGLAVVPLHGRGNKNGAGAPVKVLLYHKPEDVRGEWKSTVLDESLHVTHNFDLTRDDGSGQTGILLGGREGVVMLEPPKWARSVAVGKDGLAQSPAGAGEVRAGKLAAKLNFIAAVEPMHGNQLVVYAGGKELLKLDRRVLTEKLNQGHALACGDLLGTGSDQIVVGWRGGKPGDSVGVAVWTALDEKGEKWRETVIDANGMACEDLKLADLDGDGDLDIVASGRATKNVVIYWNER